MNIFHYSLGLSPYRSGGLTRYSEDLMKQQVSKGHNVSVLFPSGISFFNQRMNITKSERMGIKIYCINNPTPVSLYHGIKKPMDFYSNLEYDEKVFEDVVDEVNPDVFHIHTLMGLPLKILKLLHDRGVKIVYTSHDYFGLCLKTNFIDIHNHLCDGPSASKCAYCNQNAPSTSFLRFRNEPCVLALKNKLKKYLKFQDEGMTGHKKLSDDCYINSYEYEKLIDYYHQIFSYINKFHFNSLLSESIYIRNLKIKDSVVIPITNSSISDNRVFKSFENRLKICFIGSTKIFKGFPMLKSVLMNFKDADWSLDVWGGNIGTDQDIDKIRYRGKFDHCYLKDIYMGCDLVIVPSVWYETFSFVVLEALSYGTPVAVSTHVGAKDLVKEYGPKFIFNGADQLRLLLHELISNKDELKKYNHNIINKGWYHSMKDHCLEIENNLYL